MSFALNLHSSMMDLCTKCEDKQNWLLENNDGSQVICTCIDRFSEEQVREPDGDGDREGVVADSESTSATRSDVAVQTPKRRSNSFSNTDAPMRKVMKVDRKLWMNPGCDIRRNLFADYNWEKMEKVKYQKWAILRVDSITTSPFHRCTRRLYIGDKDGRNYLEIEFYPCVPYKDLHEGYKNTFSREQHNVHHLAYNPIRRAPPCTAAISKVNDFIVFNNIEIILYNGGPGKRHSGRAELEMCKELRVPYLNIAGVSQNYMPKGIEPLVHPPPVFEEEPDLRDQECIFAPPFYDIEDMGDRQGDCK